MLQVVEHEMETQPLAWVPKGGGMMVVSVCRCEGERRRKRLGPDLIFICGESIQSYALFGLGSCKKSVSMATEFSLSQSAWVMLGDT